MIKATIEGISVEVNEGSVDWRALEDIAYLQEGDAGAVMRLPKLAHRIVANWDSVIDQLVERDGHADIATCTRIILRAVNMAAGATTEEDAKN